MIKEGVTPRERAVENIIADAMLRIEELEAEFHEANMVAEYDREVIKRLMNRYDFKVIKQMKKLVNRMARDIGADDQYVDVV